MESTITMTNNAGVWSYFRIIPRDEQIVGSKFKFECNICLSGGKNSTLSSNKKDVWILKRHLLKLHNTLAHQLGIPENLLMSRSERVSSHISSHFEPNNLLDRYSSYPKLQPIIGSTNDSSVDEVDISRISSIATLSQDSNWTQYPNAELSSKLEEECIEDIVMFVITGDIAFNALQNLFFRKILKRMNPVLRVSRYSFSRRLLPQMHNKMKDEIKKVILICDV